MPPRPGVRPVAASSGRRLAPLIYDLIKERLLEGGFQAGERLPVEALKTRVRGVQAADHGGAAPAGQRRAWSRSSRRSDAACRSTSGMDVADFFAVFGGMEGAVAGVAAQRCTDRPARANLSAVNEEISRLDDEPDPAVRAHGYRVLNRRFHAHHPRHGPLARRGRDQPPDVGHVRPADQHQRSTAAARIRRVRPARRPRAHHRGPRDHDEAAARREMEAHIVGTVTIIHTEAGAAE